MYLIGIDIAKFKHDCFIATEAGEVIRNSFSFDNSEEGFTLLLKELDALDHSKQIKIGLEATGHYGNNLKLFLNEHKYSFMEFNPYLVAQFSKSKTMRRTKTDKLDAMMIAKYLTEVDYKPYSLSSYHISSLKSLSRLREAYIKQRSLQLIRLTNVLDQIFPEFKPFFNGKFSTTAIYVLKKYQTPSRISKLSDEEINELHKKSRKTAASKFVKLRELAKNTVGHQEPYFIFQLKSILNLYHSIDDEVTNVEIEITKIMNVYDTHITSIPGISIYSAASIIGEYGDLANYRSPAAMLAFGGLEPSKDESGASINKDGKMVKHGSPHLRYTLMNLAMTVITHNATFYTYYCKKHYTEIKKHRVSLSHVARKLVRLIYHLEIMKIDFNPSLLK